MLLKESGRVLIGWFELKSQLNGKQLSEHSRRCGLSI
jgi:hypothetical protein